MQLGRRCKVIRAWQGSADGTGGNADCLVSGTLQQCYQTNAWSPEWPAAVGRKRQGCNHTLHL